MKTTNIQSRISARPFLPIAARQMHNTILIALLFVISMVLVPWGTVTAEVSGDAVKWHPGHYYTLMQWSKTNPKLMARVYSELKATPALRGLQIRYLWAELEKSEGVYDFTSIDKLLTELSAQGKRLVIQVQTKSFSPDWKLVPDYLKAAKYEGGQFAFSRYGTTTIKGYNIKLWNPLVRDRLIALFRALGERYNSHPYFEGIGMIESAMGQPKISITNTQVDGFYDNLLYVHQQMRTFFPNTITIQEVNYPRSILKSFTGKLKEMKTALSGPDTYPDDPGLNIKGNANSPDGIYSYYPKLSGHVPLTPSVMQSNYKNTRSDGRGTVPSVSALLSFARDNLKANYIFWTRDPSHYPQVLELLNLPGQTSDPAGGLDPTCPKAFSSCVN